MKQGNVLRGWGLVTWRPQNESSLKANFVLHEKNVEKVFTEIANVTGDFINVCAYDNLTVSGTLLDELLQSHEFHMTDTTLTRSHLYNKKPILFPQIIEQINVESELINENVRKEKIKTARELAANIAHELYNPLSVIKGRLKLLDEMEGVNDQIQTHLTSIKNTVVKMERVVSEYLSLAKSYGENNNNINILQMMEEVKTYINFDIEVKNIDLTIVSEHKELMINCDVFKMKQVFYHLIKNAIEAMEVGTITLNLKEAGEFIYIDVSDNGPGIPDNILSKIGEPFMSTKENGAGLGLLISEKIIREHNGKLFLNTEVSKGTTITIRLEKAQ